MLEQNMDTFFDHYRRSYPTLTTDYDPEWSSPCEVGSPFVDPSDNQSQRIAWQPVKRHPTAEDFNGLENALEISIHPDVKTHYQRYWSANLNAVAPQGPVSLLYLWNQTDSDRLIENLIGHSMACRQNKTPFSVFFACTEDGSDRYLTINNITGQVQLEEPAKPPLNIVADSLASFMELLVPAPEQSP